MRKGSRYYTPAVVLTAVLLLSSVPAVVHAQTTNLNQIRAKIAELESRMKDLERNISDTSESITTFDSNKYIFIGNWPVEKSAAEKIMATAILLGRTTPEQAVTTIQAAVLARKEFVVELRRDLADLNRELEKARNERSYYLNELARLSSAAAAPKGNNSAEGISGVWNLACCSGRGSYKYSGSVTITQSGGALKGSFDDNTPLQGTIAGNVVNFTRQMGGNRGQTYTMTLSGSQMTGKFACHTPDSCDGDRQIGTDVRMTRR